MIPIQGMCIAPLGSTQPISRRLQRKHWHSGRSCPTHRSAEEFRNSLGDVPRAGTGASYLCCSNCDESNLKNLSRRFVANIFIIGHHHGQNPQTKRYLRLTAIIYSRSECRYEKRFDCAVRLTQKNAAIFLVDRLRAL